MAAAEKTAEGKSTRRSSQVDIITTILNFNWIRRRRT